MLALCASSCGVSRKATSSSEQLKIKSEALQVVRDSVVVELRDTLRETNTITITQNDKGDTLKVVQVTERDRIKNRDRVRDEQQKTVVKTDTVYIEKTSDEKVVAAGPGVEIDKDGNVTKNGAGLRSTLKWIFFIILGLTGLIITVKVCLRKVF